MIKKEIYLAGGCFWGMQRYFEEIQGVLSADAGYANGSIQNPSYEQVCTQKFGFAETIHVCYDASIVSLSFLLKMYYAVIDPTSLNKQGNDIGLQYRTGIYFTDANDQPIIESSLQELAKQYRKEIVVECQPLQNFYLAEAYHQKYLEKNPQGYCHISWKQIHEAGSLKDDLHEQ